MCKLKERTDYWPGADTVDILGEWLARFDFTHPVAFTWPPPAGCSPGMAGQLTAECVGGVFGPPPRRGAVRQPRLMPPPLSRKHN
ncbi:hypothetical protein [Streptomyces mirabilis]|uniref:hypothetical protein n=1 Tax=Streptomyces mirabilis TaxID=68239 RepID=UPI0036E7DC86